MDSSNQPYSFPELQQAETLVEVPSRDADLSARIIRRHVILFVITFCTAALTGSAQAVREPMPETVAGIVFGPYITAFRHAGQGNFSEILSGVLFAGLLLMILAAHEFGHYLACRYYRVRATLPFFIPAPPYPLTPFGTFGAVIRIKQHITSRRALFDIGIAGPLAGFAFALPVAVVGLMIAEAAEPSLVKGMVFEDPPLFALIIDWFSLPKWIHPNPVHWAAWGTVLVTALNLFPVGQLDGGHVVYAVAGPRIHKWVSLLVCVGVAGLAIASQVLHGSPMWFLWAVVLAVMAKIGHPPTYDNAPLGKLRLVIAVIGLIVFLLCFMPFPITFR